MRRGYPRSRAAVSERRKPLGIRERRSETAFTEFRLRNYRDTLIRR